MKVIKFTSDNNINVVGLYSLEFFFFWFLPFFLETSTIAKEINTILETTSQRVLAVAD